MSWVNTDKHRLLFVLLDLLIVEALPVYIFYACFLDVLTNLGAFAYLWRADTELPEGIDSPGDFSYTVLTDMWYAIFYVGGPFEGKVVKLKGCIVGWVNYGCILICLAGILNAARVTFLRGGMDVNSGRYLASKWDALAGPGYKILSIAMCVYTLTCFVIGFWRGGFFDMRQPKDRQAAMDFIFYKSVPLCMLFLNAYLLAANRHLPKFNYETDEFQAFRFRRDAIDILFQPAERFTMKLEHAITLARLGNTEELDSLLQNPEQLEEVVRTCSFDGDDSSESDHEREMLRHALQKISPRDQKLMG
jgi:hypothetical protein